MNDWAPAKWRKIHADFVSSVKLRGIGSDARAILSTMIASAWWDDSSSEGRMYLGEDLPMTIEQIVTTAECSSAKAGRDAWDRLARLKVVGIVDGCPALLRFRAAQRADSTERTRRFRERSGNGGETPIERGGNEGEPSHVTEAEAEAEAEAERTTPTPPREGSSSGISNETRAEAEYASRTVGDPKPSRRKPREAYPAEFEAAFVDAFTAACKSAQPPRRGPTLPLSETFRDSLRRLWAAEHPTVDDVRHVIDVRARLDAAGDQHGSLDWIHICRPQQFCRYRDKPCAIGIGAARPKPWTPSDFGELDNPDGEEPKT
jgi:hypothetical protein